MKKLQNSLASAPKAMMIAGGMIFLLACAAKTPVTQTTVAPTLAPSPATGATGNPMVVAAVPAATPTETTASIATPTAPLVANPMTPPSAQVLAAPSLSPIANQPAAPGTPISVIQKYESEIRQIIVRFEGRRNPKVVAERNRVLGNQVRRYFAFEELARLTLINHWKSLSAEQKNRFTDTFVKLIERSYLNKSREMIADYQVVYNDQQIDGNQARVNSTIKKNDVDVKVGYEMKRIRRGSAQDWIIFNVVIDNFDLLNNYKSQFNRIITQKSFSELMKTMENRLQNPAETVKL